MEPADKGQDKNPKGAKNKSYGLLRRIALSSLALAVPVSLVLMLFAGRRNDSVWLMVLFMLWVLSPFAVLGIANFFSKRWSVGRRKKLYALMAVVSLASLALYIVDAIDPPVIKSAFVFVVVPGGSLLVIAFVGAITFGITRLRNRN